VCGYCGDRRKPACDQDPDCAFHCFGGEHDDTIERALDDWQWFHFGRVELQEIVADIN